METPIFQSTSSSNINPLVNENSIKPKMVTLAQPNGIHLVRSDKLKSTFLELAKSLYLLVCDSNDKLNMTITENNGIGTAGEEFYILKCSGFTYKSYMELGKFLEISSNLRINFLYLNKNVNTRDTTICFKVFCKDAMDVINMTPIDENNKALSSIGRKHKKAIRPSTMNYNSVPLTKKIKVLFPKGNITTLYPGYTEEECKAKLILASELQSKEQLLKFIRHSPIHVSKNISNSLSNSKDISEDFTRKINEIRYHLIEEQHCDTKLFTVIEDIRKSNSRIIQIEIKIKLDELDFIDLKKLSIHDFAKDVFIDFSEYALLFRIVSDDDEKISKKIKKDFEFNVINI